MKILIADDSKIARKGVLKSLSTAFSDGFDYREASNGAEAVEIYSEYRPDIVFMDLTMPEKSGMEALEEIKSVNPSAKVVIITADIQKKTTEMVAELGADEILNKPVTAEKISQIISKLV
jgi:two-component system chemotaxis response regulator CheY